MRAPVLLPILAATLLATASSCAVSRLILGDEKPVDEKSSAWGVLDLSQADSAWKKIDSVALGRQGPDTEGGRAPELSDVTFQHAAYASIIALNSACRRAQDPADKDLRTLTTQLLLGITDPSGRQEEAIRVSGLPGLQTTVDGAAGGEKMKIRTVVVRREHCVYDLIYIAKPDRFETSVGDFSKFVSSLKLKE